MILIEGKKEAAELREKELELEENLKKSEKAWEDDLKNNRPVVIEDDIFEEEPIVE